MWETKASLRKRIEFLEVDRDVWHGKANRYLEKEREAWQVVLRCQEKITDTHIKLEIARKKIEELEERQNQPVELSNNNNPLVCKEWARPTDLMTRVGFPFALHQIYYLHGEDPYIVAGVKFFEKRFFSYQAFKRYCKYMGTPMSEFIKDAEENGHCSVIVARLGEASEFQYMPLDFAKFALMCKKVNTDEWTERQVAAYKLAHE